MLDPSLVRAEPARVRAGLERRGADAAILDRLLQTDGRWVAKTSLADSLRTRRRRVSEEIARQRGEGADTADLEQIGREVADQMRTVERELAALRAARREALLLLPNLPAPEVPEETTVLHETPPRARRGLVRHSPEGEGGSGGALPHWDIIKMLDLARPASSSAGRGFLLWRGAGARLLRALEAFMLDLHTRQFACAEVRCPSLATREALEGSAHLPGLEEKMYALSEPGAGENDPRCLFPDGPDGCCAEKTPGVFFAPRRRLEGGARLFLVPRAEPHLANLFRGEILEAGALPARFVAAGPALRREADHGGSAGRGLLRLHEFPTVEVYAFCRPEESEAELERAAEAATGILARLDVPHRRLLRGARHLSRAAAKTIDLEVWAAGLEQWLPVAALSSFTDYQARRTETRFRAADGKPRLVHTVGGAAVAIPHLVAAILENGQEADGSVRLPEALWPYLDGRQALGPASGG